MEIQQVANKKQLNEFISFPYSFYKNSPAWIPPLRLDQRDIFSAKKNRILQHSDYAFFLLKKEKEIVGRIAVYIDKIAISYWKEKVGFFGHYECIEDSEAANLLLSTAENWLRERGMKKMRGPWNLVSQDIGFVFDGFDVVPTIMSSFNPPYYNEQVQKFGLSKAKDLLVYSCDTGKGYQIPERFLKFTDAIVKRYGVTVRPINMKKIKEDAHTIVWLTNESLKNNWGYYPIEDDEAEQIAADLKMIVHPEVVLIAEVDGKPIGYIITLPDVNDILKDLNGKLFPLGIFKLLRGVKKLNRYRIWALGILEPYQKKGISVLMFRRLHEALSSRNVYVEANWVLEDNDLMNNALRRLKFDLVKRYRIYQKNIYYSATETQRAQR